jgi:hypothetical protein
MSAAGKLKLTVRQTGLVDDGDDRTITLGLFDLMLPCRSFKIDHKAAEVGKVSITAEFLLRLLKSVGKMREEAVAEYFGYDLREMDFVLGEVEAEGLVLRSDGWLSLTLSGEEVFRPGDDEPVIYEVEQRTGIYGFDLISMAPQQREHLSIFETRLPELEIVDIDRVSNATVAVGKSFKRFYAELSPRRPAAKSIRRSLYSIDSIDPKDRFFSIVRVLVNAKGTKPAEGEIDLSEWRAEFELADREAVVIAVARFAELLRTNRRVDDDLAYSQMIRFAPDFFKDFTRKNGLAVERYYKEAFSRVGEVRSDRRTIPILGSLFTPENVRRLMHVAGYGLRALQETPETVYWLPPQVSYWGMARALPELVDHFKDALTVRNEEIGLSVSRPLAVALCQGKPSRWTEKAFDYCGQTDRLLMPGGIELLLIPGAFAAALVHAPVGAQSGHVVPLGLASFDPQVVDRITALLREFAPSFGLSELLIRDLSAPDDSEN